MSRTEQQEAYILSDWLKLNGYKFTHIPNETGGHGKLQIIQAIKKRKMGVSIGFPDYVIILKRGSFLFIELKRERNTKKDGTLKALSSDGIEIRPEQIQWIDSLNAVDNVDAYICFGADEAIETIKRLEDY